jgi:anion-transporting  ArsA/GET3 family ATPase
VLDAPPTGRLPRFLEAPRAVVELVHSGPIRQQAQGVLDMVSDPERCQVVLVTLPEEMPVTETAEAVETMTKLGVALGPIVVNGVYPRRFEEPDLEPVANDARSVIAPDAERAGITLGDPALDALSRIAGSHARRTLNQQDAIAELERETGLPHLTLPHLFSQRMGKDEVAKLADVLAEQRGLG